MSRTRLLVIAVIFFIGMAPLAVTAQDATPADFTGSSLLAGLGYPMLEVTTDGTSLDIPTELAAGRYHVVFHNSSELDTVLEFLQLPEGLTPDDYLAALYEAYASDDATWSAFLNESGAVFNGGTQAFANETGEVVLDLTPGEWAVNLYTFDPATEEETDAITMVTVTGEMPEISTPSSVVKITMGEMSFEVPEGTTAGPQVWNIVNESGQAHHLFLRKNPEGTTIEQVQALLRTFFGIPATPGASPAAGMAESDPPLALEDVEQIFDSLTLSPGQLNMVALDLAPGTYALLCYLPAPDGMMHALQGQIEIVVLE